LLFAQLFPEYQALAMIGFLGNFAGSVGDLWISEKLIDKVHNYIPLDKEEIVKIIIRRFEHEFRMEEIIINSVSFGDDSPSEYTNLNW
jgi:hypothetical protein